jgi:hypothetical protein
VAVQKALGLDLLVEVLTSMAEWDMNRFLKPYELDKGGT